jgi:2,4-dienoyl-CoA reductase-like NADH-dependent reductase (Old Yellow Enzyme family)
VPGLKRCADFIRQHNAVPGIQLGHSGRKARRFRPWEGGAPLKNSPDVWDWEGWELVSSSALNSPETDPTPRALTREEIPQVIEHWGQGARRAHEAGFEVLDLHMAHGYLIHQFLSPFSNLRNDEYGGSELNCMRFAIEVVESVRAHWPASKPLFVRFSVEDDAGWGPDQSVALAKLIKPKGVDVIDCSSGGMRGSPVVSAGPVTYGYQVPYADRLKRDADIMTMAVGLIIHGDQAERILQKGQADLIAVGREILNNPNWPMDAALKLGVEGPFRNVPPQFGYWLGTRAKRGFGTNPSTWQLGLEVGHEETRKVL